MIVEAERSQDHKKRQVIQHIAISKLDPSGAVIEKCGDRNECQRDPASPLDCRAATNQYAEYERRRGEEYAHSETGGLEERPITAEVRRLKEHRVEMDRDVADVKLREAFAPGCEVLSVGNAVIFRVEFIQSGLEDIAEARLVIPERDEAERDDNGDENAERDKGLPVVEQPA